MKFFFPLFLILTACAHSASRKEAFPTPLQAYVKPTLDFYSTHDPYGEFSNFAAYPVFVDNQWWPTSEHYYQAHKYKKPELMEWVRSASTPLEAALRGRDKNIPKRADWEQRKDEFMEKAVKDKFTRHENLRRLLLSTGDARLYEHTANDCYWADCGDRSGKNKLGHLLEKIRQDLRNQPSNQ
jgi:ribA/ribD-fused uncharacterized protein